MIMVGDRLLSVEREPVDWLPLSEVASLLSSLSVCNVELGRPTWLSPPYPMVMLQPTDVCFGPPACYNPPDVPDTFDSLSANPPYPPASCGGLMLPEVLVDGEMPEQIQTPQCVREMNTLEEEEDVPLPPHPDSVSLPPVVLPSSDSPTNLRAGNQPSTCAVRPATQSQRLPAPSSLQDCYVGFHIHQISLPPAPQPRPEQASLGLELADGRGISGPTVTRVLSGSPSHLAGLRVGDRLLAVNGKLVHALGSNKSTNARMHAGPLPAEEILSIIEREWMSSVPGDPVLVTLVSKVVPEDGQQAEQDVFKLGVCPPGPRNGLPNGDSATVAQQLGTSSNGSAASYSPQKPIKHSRAFDSQLAALQNVEIVNGDDIPKIHGPMLESPTLVDSNYETSDRRPPSEVVLLGSNGPDHLLCR